MQYSSKTSKVCAKEHKQSEPVTGNRNSDATRLLKKKTI